MWQEFGVLLFLPLCFLTTYPAPDSNSVFVDEAHLDEFPKTQQELSQSYNSNSWSQWCWRAFPVKAPGHKPAITSSVRPSGVGDIDSTEPVVTFLTWLLLSDLPPHRFPDVCRWCALTCRLGNRFPFRRSWQQWFSQCWRGTWPSSRPVWNVPFGYRARHTYRTKFINCVFVHILKPEYFNWMDNWN